MKIKGDNEEQVALANQIRDCNTEILNQLKAFIEEDKAFPINENDDAASKETKARYKKQALAGVKLAAAELTNPDAKFHIEKGQHSPIISQDLLSKVVEELEGEAKETAAHNQESYQTALARFMQQGRYTYLKAVPQYEFKFL